MHSTFKQRLSKRVFATLLASLFLLSSSLNAKSITSEERKNAEIESNRLANFNLDSVLSSASLTDYLEPQVSVRPPSYPQRPAPQLPKKPLVGQESTYEGYYKPKDGFTQTDDYAYMASFFLGTKIYEDYKFSEECVQSFVDAADDGIYFQNNITEHGFGVENGTHNNYWEPYLNITGMIGGPIASALPNCYKFYKDGAKVEVERFRQFNNNWGDFFLAFLFNQMGNALNFQAKFTRIQENNLNQNYVGSFQEYGDLVNLIWQFPPLPTEASLNEMGSLVSSFIKDQDWVDEKEEPLKALAYEAGLHTLCNYVYSTGQTIGAYLEGGANNFDAFFTKRIRDYFGANADTIPKYPKYAKPSNSTQSASSSEEKAKGSSPQVGFTLAPYDNLQSTLDLGYGFANGVVDVFPYQSNPNRCRTNTTQFYGALDNLFLTRNYQWQEVDEDVKFVTDMSYLLEFPFGASYSCWYGFSTLVIQSDPWEDGKLTEDEELEMKIRIAFDFLTNIFFNAGYMYSDIVSLYNLPATAENYWQKFGIYSGDFTIRIFWRKYFIRNFEY